MYYNFVKDSILAQMDLKGLSPKLCSQQIVVHSSSILLKVDGATDPVVAHSPFQVNCRDKDGILSTKTVVMVGNSKEEAQAFVLDEEVAFSELKGVKVKEIDDDLIDCNSTDDFNGLKNIKNRKCATLRNTCVIGKGLLQKFASEGAKSTDEMVQVLIGSCFRREINEEGDEILELIENGTGEFLEMLHYLGAFGSGVVRSCTLKPCLPGSAEANEFSRRRNSVFQNGDESLRSEEKKSLVAALKQNTEVMMASFSSASRSIETKPKERLSKSTLSTLKNVLTVDGESSIDEFRDEAKDVLNGSSEMERAHTLDTNLRRSGIHNTCLSLQQTKDICDGRLGYRSNEVPGGTSMLLVQRNNIDYRVGSAETLRIIDLKSKNVGIDNDSFDKLTKTSVILPTTMTELIENIETISKVFHTLSEDCFVARKLDDLISVLRMNQRLIQSYCNKTEDGVTLILAAFDRKLKNFIDQVTFFPENLKYICNQFNFDKIISDLNDGTFHFTDVPSCIKNLGEPSKERCNKRRKLDNYKESIEKSLSETE